MMLAENKLPVFERPAADVEDPPPPPPPPPHPARSVCLPNQTHPI